MSSNKCVSLIAATLIFCYGCSSNKQKNIGLTSVKIKSIEYPENLKNISTDHLPVVNFHLSIKNFEDSSLRINLFDLRDSSGSLLVLQKDNSRVMKLEFNGIENEAETEVDTLQGIVGSEEYVTIAQNDSIDISFSYLSKDIIAVLQRQKEKGGTVEENFIAYLKELLSGAGVGVFFKINSDCVYATQQNEVFFRLNK